MIRRLILSALSRHCTWCGGHGSYYETTEAGRLRPCLFCACGRHPRYWVSDVKEWLGPISEIWRKA